MTPEGLAALHAQSMPGHQAWSAADFASSLASPQVFLFSEAVAMPDPASAPAPDVSGRRLQLLGFGLGRVAADEAELLTLAVVPAVRRRGIGRMLLSRFEAEALSRGAVRGFLEVAAGNAAAHALYRSHGYAETAIRPDYYRGSGGLREDAILMSKGLR